MSEVRERMAVLTRRPVANEVALDQPHTRRAAIAPRVLGAIAVLVVGAVHPEQ